VGKPEGKTQLRQRRRWVDNIKIDPGETVMDGKDWTGLDWLRIGSGDELL
jgi:hypothetical protein